MRKRICMVIAVAAFGCRRLPAQTLFGIECATEMQTDFKNLNWVNLLKMNFSQALCKGLRFDLGSISVARTRAERLVDDLQVFSNIEEENLPFSLSVAGISFCRGRLQIFAGIRNMNEDYFTSPVTSLFTNSSCGLFPTVSVNFPIANYPLSSLGVHCAFVTEHWEVQASIYNGRGYDGFTGDNSPFRFCPASDGLCGIFSSIYRNNGSSYCLGGVLYGGLHVCTGQTEGRSVSGALWGYAEQRVVPWLDLLVQYSMGLSSDLWCRLYGGLGMRGRFRKVEIGVFSDCAVFSGTEEWASELTCRIPLSPHADLQPAMHLIRGAFGFRTVALMRLNVSL